MNNGRDCEHGRQVGKCDSCDLIQAENTIARLLAGKWDGTELALISSTQVIADIRAESLELGYYNGFKDALVIEPPLPPVTGTSATIDVFAYRVEQSSRYAASQYAAKINQENQGTWLKDSNVNGGKRQGGE